MSVCLCVGPSASLLGPYPVEAASECADGEAAGSEDLQQAMGKAVELDRELGAVQRKLRRQEEVHEEALRQCSSLQEQVLDMCGAAVPQACGAWSSEMEYMGSLLVLCSEAAPCTCTDFFQLKCLSLACMQGRAGNQ